MTRLVFGLLLGVLGAGLHRGPGETLLELPAASPALACWGPALALALAGGAVLLAPHARLEERGLDEDGRCPAAREMQDVLPLIDVDDIGGAFVFVRD